MNPNIILIMTDQQRGDTLGSMGNPVIRTPNLHRLATAQLRPRSAPARMDRTHAQGYIELCTR